MVTFYTHSPACYTACDYICTRDNPDTNCYYVESKQEVKGQLQHTSIYKQDTYCQYVEGKQEVKGQL